MSLTVVTGPPCAGKTTYVRERAKPGDIIIDFDLLAVALGSPDSHDHPPAIATVAATVRLAAIDAAATTGANTWLIHAQPTPQALADYRKQGAHIITLDPGEHTTRQRIATQRPPQAQQWADKWYRSQTSRDPAAPTTRTNNRVCLEPGCPRVQPGPRCAEHHTGRTPHAQSTAQRGYGPTHKALREQWKPKVDAGQVNCARCGRHIKPGTPWDLGHDDQDRTKYRGPEHVACNRATRGQHKAPAHPGG